jgi:general secretion pathway protein I
MPNPRFRTPRGFTLVEVLIALAIVSIALLAALRAAGQGTANVGELRGRLLAGWIAQNRLETHQALADWPATGVLRGIERAGGTEFAWREDIVETPNTAFRRVEVFVFAPPGESRTLAHLTGFVVHPPQGPR